MTETDSGIAYTSLHRCASNECAQGRKPCPTPAACELPIDEEPALVSVAVAIGWVLLWIATIAVACGGAAWAGLQIMDWLEPHWPRFVFALAAI